jgi:hypothetical protein
MWDSKIRGDKDKKKWEDNVNSINADRENKMRESKENRMREE